MLGIGKPSALDEQAWLKVGGAVQTAARKAKKVTVILDVAGAEASSTEAAQLAMGILLRAYTFDKYKTRKDDANGDGDKETAFVVACADPAGAKKKFAELEGIAGGVLLARDLVNEPANILGPLEFAAKAKELESLGVEVEILHDADMEKLGMGALLGVAQGSERPARMVVMKWNGGKAKDKPVAFVGKGVVFDSGGISIK
ncbi:MAG: M17 family peptidase N-terminal domain-containing protein, partial [Sphingopyxis sp.]|uniref:M17 family peptidase N-terminal domain-containing protein n=1 Tax=Sphingopyxis sp. TaxID=1908224 RepID=UPI004036301D